MIKLLLFDLDDTLYEERTFVLSGYRAVARELSRFTNASEDEIYSSLVSRLASHGRQGAFDAVLDTFGVDCVDVKRLVRLYRSHVPAIHVAPETVLILRQLKERYRLALITNGWVSAQKRKVAALRLQDVFDAVFYAQEAGMAYRKPHGRFFKRALRKFGVSACEAVMIGDDPVADGAGAKAAGLDFFRVERIGDLEALPGFLASREPSAG